VAASGQRVAAGDEGRVVSNPHVRWTGTAMTPALCIPCPTCNVTINEACTDKVFPLPHRERGLHAEVYGFVAIDTPGGLFERATA
jgi:hypothetical protein